MMNIQFGGRFTNNLISDVVPPEVLNKVKDDRIDESNFRSFPEIGRNFRRVYVRPAAKALSISVKEIASISRINVIWNHPKVVDITFVPPISSFAYIGYANDGGAPQNQSSIMTKISKLVDRIK